MGNDTLETDNYADGIIKHVHGDFFCRCREGGTEDGLLDFWMCASGDDLLNLVKELRVEHTICFVQYEMTDTVAPGSKRGLSH